MTMEKKYTSTVSHRTPRPRSERLRKLGGSGCSSSGSTVVNITGGTSQIESHTHRNLATLERLGADDSGYLYVDNLKETEDGDGLTNVREKVKAGYADRAGMAHDLDPDSPVRDQFLSKLADDVAAGHITFEKGVTALLLSYFQDGAHFGNFVQGLAGAMIDRAGNAEFESITSRGYLKVFELIYNRLNALEGDTSFADVGTIETIEDGDNGAQVLTMRKRWDGDFTAFQPGDIVYGYVNNLSNGGASEYYKAWAWIKSVDRAANTLSVVPYADSEVPAGKNHPLTASMIITRWGNNVEANAYSYANKDYSAVIAKRGDNDYVNIRQTAFYISCEDGNIVELMGVNKPILEAGNYGTVLGRMPAGLLDPATQELVNKDQPYLFARGIVVQDLIRIDYGGKITRTANYRGAWNAQTAVSASDYYRSTPGTYDTVTWNGDLWQCVASGTTDEPSETSGDWVNMTGRRKEKELRIWTINPTASIISVRKDEVLPEKVGCTVSLYSSDNATRLIESSYDLLQEGVKLYYSLDGIAWKEFIMGNTEPLDLEDGTGVIELEATDGDNMLTVGGDDVDTAEIGDRIYFELREIETDMPLTATQVPVVKDGINGSFKSRVFKRTNSTNVETPTGGTYENPIPEGWEDGVPEGREVLWTSVCTFYADGSSSGWSKPAQETDTATLDIEFSPNETQPEAPTGSTPFAGHEAEGWYDPSSKNFGGKVMIWRAERKVSNGVYNGDWTITRIYGEKGDKGERAPFQSTVFIRSNSAPAKPTGGTYENPVPTSAPAWSNAIPEGEQILWASTRLFDDNQETQWETPRQMTDTATYDVEFSDIDNNPGTPSTDPTKWFDPVKDKATKDFTKMLWRAERRKKNGTWGDWTIVRIKGEKGDKGQDGQDGENGLPGRDGLMVYPVGYFDENTRYSATSETAPVSKYGDNFYALKRGATYYAPDMPDNRKTPAGDVAYGGSDARWQVFDKFNAIFADIIMADFAKLASAVFYGDWLISQQGTLTYTQEYRYMVSDTALSPLPDQERQSDYPTGWSTAYPANVPTGSSVYFIMALKCPNGVLASGEEWTTPAVTTAEKTGAKEVTQNSLKYQEFKNGAFEPNFSVNFRTGEMRAANGVFSGSLRTQLKRLEESDAKEVGSATINMYAGVRHRIQKDLDLNVSSYSEIELPTDISYVGARITICESAGAYTRNLEYVAVVAQGGGIIGGIKDKNAETELEKPANVVRFLNGTVQFLGVMAYDYDSAADPNPITKWMLVSACAEDIYGYKM